MNIQKTLDSLQPYVIGIRYLEGTPLVDAVFKEGWNLPTDPNIKQVKGNEEMNYYMILSENTNVGLDELLNFVEKTIKLNIEREKKHDLLKIKFNELKEVFKKNSLEKLKNLKFVFSEEDLLPSLNEFDMDDLKVEDIIVNEIIPNNSIEEQLEINNPSIENIPYLDENHNPIELSDEEREILAEEARGAQNRKFLENKNRKNDTKKIISKVELPPKQKLVLETTIDYSGDCECGPEEACEKCIDNKY